MPQKDFRNSIGTFRKCGNGNVRPLSGLRAIADLGRPYHDPLRTCEAGGLPKFLDPWEDGA
jgi:hypothetical protein